MKARIKNIVIVGGGAAGWITAGLLASKHTGQGPSGINVTVVESPDIPIVGVGEGTWPSMRTTLRKMGVNEREFVKACNVAFKQGSKFRNWRNGAPDDFYYHPFDPPHKLEEWDVAACWLAGNRKISFSNMVCPQEAICEAGLSPKSPTSPDFAGFTNYGYHLDAGAFSVFLRKHCTEKLGVSLVADTMTRVVPAENGDIAAVETERNGLVTGDLFIDCTGFRSLLLGQHYGVGLVSKSDTLFVDTAIAVQVPYAEDEQIQSATVATAQPAGWVWDISLSSRRGMGHVYSSHHMDEDRAADCIRRYLGMSEGAFSKLSYRKLSIGSGYREVFWNKNCVAIGLSAGFLEPLEASALMLIENCANMLSAYIKENSMEKAARQFNETLYGLWDNIIHFLKLHYCLSQRNEPFWKDNRDPSSVPVALLNDLEKWRSDIPSDEEGAMVFPAASYQYVLYGMGYGARSPETAFPADITDAGEQVADLVARLAQRLRASLMSNRDIIQLLKG